MKPTNTKAYPAGKRRSWNTQVEFLDGHTIDAVSDEDAIERWRRMAAWSDPVATSNPTEWMQRVLTRAREFYQADLRDIDAASSATDILDALSRERCLDLRRK